MTVGPDTRSGAARFTVAGLALTPGDNAPGRLDGTLDADWRNNTLNLKGDFTGQGDAKIALNASMPLNYIPNTGDFDLPESGHLKGDVAWNADIGPFWNAFGPDTQTLQGRVDAALKLGGTIADPTATGDIMLHDGRYMNLEMGTVLDKLMLRLEATRQEVRLVEGSATDGGSGKVTASGTIGLDPDSSTSRRTRRRSCAGRMSRRLRAATCPLRKTASHPCFRATSGRITSMRSWSICRAPTSSI